jgi:hypothetical protein
VFNITFGVFDHFLTMRLVSIKILPSLGIDVRKSVRTNHYDWTISLMEWVNSLVVKTSEHGCQVRDVRGRL